MKFRIKVNDRYETCNEIEAWTNSKAGFDWLCSRVMFAKTVNDVSETKNFVRKALLMVRSFIFRHLVWYGVNFTPKLRYWMKFNFCSVHPQLCTTESNTLTTLYTEMDHLH